jgi:hypothetical protein
MFHYKESAQFNSLDHTTHQAYFLLLIRTCSLLAPAHQEKKEKIPLFFVDAVDGEWTLSELAPPATVGSWLLHQIHR